MRGYDPARRALQERPTTFAPTSPIGAVGVMHIRLAARRRDHTMSSQGKAALGKADLWPAPRAQGRPEPCDPFALGERVGGAKADARVAGRVLPGLDQPRADAIARTARLARRGDAAHLSAPPRWPRRRRRLGLAGSGFTIAS